MLLFTVVAYFTGIMDDQLENRFRSIFSKQQIEVPETVAATLGGTPFFNWQIKQLSKQQSADIEVYELVLVGPKNKKVSVKLDSSGVLEITE
jgi:hypothetical protein